MKIDQRYITLIETKIENKTQLMRISIDMTINLEISNVLMIS